MWMKKVATAAIAPASVFHPERFRRRNATQAAAPISARPSENRKFMKPMKKAAL